MNVPSASYGGWGGGGAAGYGPGGRQSGGVGWGAGPPRPPLALDSSYGGYGSGGGNEFGGGLRYEQTVRSGGVEEGGGVHYEQTVRERERISGALGLAGLHLGGGGGGGGNGGTGDYLMGALETALGGGNAGDRSLQSEDRRRAQAVVKQVAEALADREDLAEELEEARDKAEAAEARATEAEKAAEKARSEARSEVAAQRDEEQQAVLAALGLAEERAVQMAAECETLREEKEAIAAALDFVNDEMEALQQRVEEAEEATTAQREEGYRTGFAAGLFSRNQDEALSQQYARTHREELGLARVRASDNPNGQMRGVHYEEIVSHEEDERSGSGSRAESGSARVYYATGRRPEEEERLAAGNTVGTQSERKVVLGDAQGSLSDDTAAAADYLRMAYPRTPAGAAATAAAATAAAAAADCLHLVYPGTPDAAAAADCLPVVYPRTPVAAAAAAAAARVRSGNTDLSRSRSAPDPSGSGPLQEFDQHHRLTDSLDGGGEVQRGVHYEQIVSRASGSTGLNQLDRHLDSERGSLCLLTHCALVHKPTPYGLGAGSTHEVDVYAAAAVYPEP